MADSRFGIALNVRRNAVSQYGGYNFNSMCVFNGQPIGANQDGIFSLEDAETDNGQTISSIVELVTSSLGALTQKRFRKAYLGYEASGTIALKVKCDDDQEHTFFLDPVDPGQAQHRGVVPMTRRTKGVYFRFRIENLNGCDFSIDDLDAVVTVLNRGHR